MVKRWRPLLLGVLTFALAVSLKNDFVFFLFGFEVMLYLAAFIQVRWLARRVKMGVVLPENTVFRGKPFEICASLTNTGILPVPRLMARVAIRVFPEREELLMKGKLMLDGQEQGNLVFAMDSAHCGCLEIRPDQLVVTDFLGLCQRRCAVDRKDKQMLFVLPATLNQQQELPDEQGSILADDGSEERRGMTAIDVSEIRPYQSGDSIKLVHWKLSARLNQLMVREMADSAERLTWLYINLQEKENALVRQNPDAWDHFMESVAAISSSLLRMDRPHVVIWMNAQSNTVMRYDVSDPQSLERMLCALLRAETFSPRDHAQILKELYANEAKGTCIEIDLQGNFIRSEGPG